MIGTRVKKKGPIGYWRHGVVTGTLNTSGGLLLKISWELGGTTHEWASDVRALPEPRRR